jgi:hypothetical protein
MHQALFFMPAGQMHHRVRLIDVDGGIGHVAFVVIGEKRIAGTRLRAGFCEIEKRVCTLGLSRDYLRKTDNGYGFDPDGISPI